MHSGAFDGQRYMSTGVCWPRLRRKWMCMLFVDCHWPDVQSSFWSGSSRPSRLPCQYHHNRHTNEIWWFVRNHKTQARTATHSKQAVFHLHIWLSRHTWTDILPTVRFSRGRISPGNVNEKVKRYQGANCVCLCLGAISTTNVWVLANVP